MALEGAARDILGILLQIVATFLAALAYVLQKLAHNEQHAHPGGSIYRNVKWLAGFFAMVVVAGLDVYSFSLLDQSKLAAFAAVTLTWNVILSALILKEKFTRIDALSVSIIAAGTILALSAAEATSKDFTLDDILGLLTDDFVYAYSTIVGFFVVVTALFIERTARLSPSSWTPFQSWSIAVVSPVLGGMCMGFTGYAAKAISAALFHADWPQFATYPIYLYIAIAAVFVTGQVRYLNTGLKFFDAMSVVPVFQAAIILSNSLAGIVYYRDLRDETPGKKATFAVGALMAIVGVNIQLLKARKPSSAGRHAGTEDERARWTSVSSDAAEKPNIPLIGASDAVTIISEVAAETIHIAHASSLSGGGGGSASSSGGKSARRRTPSTIIEMK